MSIFNFLRYFLFILVFVTVLALGVNSCASTDDSKTASDTAATTSDDDTTTSSDDDTSTTTTTSETTVAGVIYRSISVKKKNKNLNFDNAQFGNVKFQ